MAHSGTNEYGRPTLIPDGKCWECNGRVKNPKAVRCERCLNRMEREMAAEDKANFKPLVREVD